MDLKTRADLVRAHRIEIKGERESQARGYRMLNQAARVQRRVNGGIRRAGQRAGAEIGAAMDRYRAWDTANLRRSNMRNAERVRTEGYDIGPQFRRRSNDLQVQATSRGMRERAGTGVNRWRGTLAQTRADIRVAPITYHPDRSNPWETAPGDYAPARRPQMSRRRRRN